MIVSLWPVPDKETSEMMWEFYSAIAKGNNLVTSFRTAQSKMRIKYMNKPSLWAGFTLIE
jgi:CHAT domain-containing protein